MKKSENEAIILIIDNLAIQIIEMLFWLRT